MEEFGGLLKAYASERIDLPRVLATAAPLRPSANVFSTPSRNREGEDDHRGEIRPQSGRMLAEPFPKRPK